jgi:hypothetical protein
MGILDGKERPRELLSRPSSARGAAGGGVRVPPTCRCRELAGQLAPPVLGSAGGGEPLSLSLSLTLSLKGEGEERARGWLRRGRVPGTKGRRLAVVSPRTAAVRLARELAQAASLPSGGRRRLGRRAHAPAHRRGTRGGGGGDGGNGSGDDPCSSPEPGGSRAQGDKGTRRSCSR